jgi:hypothetical protein
MTSWEGNATVPGGRYIPDIIQFLGYDLLRAASSPSERLCYSAQSAMLFAAEDGREAWGAIRQRRWAGNLVGINPRA